MKNEVKVWKEKVAIPTYKTAEPDKNPLFFEKRVYQGSSGKVYPLPITEKISDEKENVEYNAVFLENEYLKVMLLPEIGGRIQRAYDKTNDYDFVYFNHVIKPALVGLVGPWISGGIEFNWPQHHRPSTFMPTEYTIQENKDGSKTVFVSEIDQMYGTKGMAGFTLYPDKAYIEITGKLYNKTDIPQTFLWWANPAVPVNDHTFSIFPPDVHAVMDHGKRAVSSFPIATGTYYKYDYSEGIDISKYKNVKVPTSYMAYRSEYDFIGNYDEEKEAGLLHVADHHFSPGKKQWTWGNSDFGKAWDSNLTDEDGPYIELMTGIYTDNQPDFTWLKPYEEKTFTQYFMPIKGVGHVKNATTEAALNIEQAGDDLIITVYASSEISGAQLTLSENNQLVFSDTLDLSPKKYYRKQLHYPVKSIDETIKIVLSKDEHILVAYQGSKPQISELPQPAKPLPEPQACLSTEELFLAATHIEQYRHATLDAEAYYLEGLKRDQTDIRLNNGYGMYLYKQGCFAKSEELFQQAVDKQMWKTPNPDYGEPLFNLGLAQLAQGKVAAAYDNFYKATWNNDTQGEAFYQLTCLETRKQNYSQALDFIEKALIKNAHNMKGRTLRAALLRLMGTSNSEAVTENLAIDPLDFGSLYEQTYNGDSKAWEQAMRGSQNNYLELAADYIQYGLLEDAKNILNKSPKISPLAYYYLAYIADNEGNLDVIKHNLVLAEAANPDYVFPNKYIEIVILSTLIDKYPADVPYAHYYLGNLYYDRKRHEEAIQLWQQAAEKLADFPTVFRNLSFAYYNQEDDLDKALAMMEKARTIDPTDARLLLEYDLLCSKYKQSLQQRIATLEKNMEVTLVRDDLYVEYVSLLNGVGNYQQSYKCIMERHFHPWEGGEGKVSNQYVSCLIGLAAESEDVSQAIQFLQDALERPANLGEGKLPNYHDNLAHYCLGKMYQHLNKNGEANQEFRKATIGSDQPESIMYYNDQPAELILYKGLAHKELKETKEANTCFHKLLSFGEDHFYDEVAYDYFAVSLPATVVFKDNLTQNNKIYCLYLMALARLGLGEVAQAHELFQQILAEKPDHLGVLQCKALMEKSLI